jgi:hypothetical protein
MARQMRCEICRRLIKEWLLRLSVQDASGYEASAFICPNCCVKLRLASEKVRSLQIDPWLHDAVAKVLKGKE